MPAASLTMAATAVRGPTKAVAAGAENGAGSRPWGEPLLDPVAAAAAIAVGAEDGGSASSGGRPKVPSHIAGNRFEIRGKLGSGSYSDVHLGIDRDTGDQVAVKFEWSKAEKTGKLLAEAKLCQTFANRGCCIPIVRWWGSEGEYNIMVMDVLGPSLEDLLEACGGTFSLRTALMMAIQMVDLLEYVHSCEIIHRDIKPNNFLIGVGDRRDRVYIVDFGLAKRYRVPETGEHIPCVKKKGLTGTVRYTTLNVHRGLEPSRRDDLGAVGYVLMYCLLGRLPWQGISAKSKRTKQRRIGRRKEQVTHRSLCTGFPDEFVKYLEYCDSLQYDEKPDYEYLRGLMRTALARECPEAPSGLAPFDWLMAPDQRPAAGKRKRPRSQDAAVAALPNGAGDGQDEEAKRRKAEALNFAALRQETEEYDDYEYESEEYEYEEEEEEEDAGEDEDEEEEEEEELEGCSDEELEDEEDDHRPSALPAPAAPHLTLR